MPVFDPEIVHECSLKCLGLPKPEMFDVFAQSLAEHYPKTLDFKQPWIYSIAGGAMIQMKLYYASPTEYIMIWGTPIGSEGHSGRHCTGFWDTVIDGEMWYYGEGEFEKKIYKPLQHPLRPFLCCVDLLRLHHLHADLDPLQRSGGASHRTQVPSAEAHHRAHQLAELQDHQGADPRAGGRRNTEEEHPLVPEGDVRHQGRGPQPTPGWGRRGRSSPCSCRWG
jgi:hypothetical protein